MAHQVFKVAFRGGYTNPERGPRLLGLNRSWQEWQTGKQVQHSAVMGLECLWW